MSKFDSKSNYQVIDILKNMNYVIKNKGVYIGLLFVVQTIFSILLFLVFKENYGTILNALRINYEAPYINVFTSQYILSILSMLIISTLINGILSIITYQEIMNKKIERSIIIQFFQCFLMYLTYYIIIFLIIILIVIVSILLLLIPIIGKWLLILLALGVFILSLYLVGYYRFIPYIAITEGFNEVFRKSKQCIKSHLALSIFIFILNTGIYEFLLIFLVIRNEIFILIVIFSNIFLFIFNFFDIAFIITRLKQYDITKQKRQNFMEFFANREDNNQTEL